MNQWENEPSEEDIEAGDLYPRYIRRMPGTGHLCGYIAVPPDHPWAGLGYDDVGCHVHGGLTYASASEEFYDGSVAPTGWTVFGFDCAHSGDLTPFTFDRLKSQAREADIVGLYGEYRTIEYVRSQLDSLAQQAKDAARS